MEILEPKRVIPQMETLEPCLMKLRNDKADPIKKKSNKDTLLPKRWEPHTDKVEPNLV
jgi:hypothetical protein